MVRSVAAVDERLDADCLYSQVPAFSASDRAMIDVLTVTCEGRLAVLELKADENIHLPLQGLDYRSRVAWHHARGEFQRFGYFPARELSSESPLLFLAAPALHVHPATDILLHYISPAIEWAVVGIDERWREGQARLHQSRTEARRRTKSFLERVRWQALRSARFCTCRDDRSYGCEPVLIFLARLPAGGVRQPTGPGDMRCDRLPTRLHAGWFDLLPTGSASVNQSLDWRPGFAWPSGLRGNS